MKYGLFILFSFCAISNTYASTDCLQRPSCEELGYIQTRSQCACFNKDVLPCPFNIKDDNTVFCGDLNCQEQCNKTTSLYSGENNTKTIVATFGASAYVPYAALQFYVGDKDGDFGQGKWYIPSIGEFMDILGTDYSKITAALGNSGHVGDNIKKINAALKALSTKGVEAAEVSKGRYWTSSEGGWNLVWSIPLDGARNLDYKTSYFFNVRVALFLKNLHQTTSSLIPPKVGDVVYLDKTYGAVEDYDGSKTVVGVVASASSNGRDATILNLKDLKFTSEGSIGNFNPENPYGEAKNSRYSSSGDNVPDIEDYNGEAFLAAIQNMCGCACGAYQCQGGNCAEYNDDCSCKRCLSLYTLDNGVCDANCAVQCQDALPLYDGKGITYKELERVGESFLAGAAASQFYVGDKDGDFGQGKWYVPAIGELIDVRGINKCLQVTGGNIAQADFVKNHTLIQKALQTLAEKGVDAAEFSSTLWSVTRASSETMYCFGPGNFGYWDNYYWTGNGCKLRSFLLVENVPAASEKSQLGDVMYTDKSYGKSDDYDGSKIPAGIVVAVSEDGSSVKIVNLKELTFSSAEKVGNFDAENPYGNTTSVIRFSLKGISEFRGFTKAAISELFNKSCRCDCEFYGVSE